MIDNPLILSFLIALVVVSAGVLLIFALFLLYAIIGDLIVILVAFGIAWYIIYQVING